MIYHSPDGAPIKVHLYKDPEKDDSEEDLVFFNENNNEIEIETFMYFSVPTSPATSDSNNNSNLPVSSQNAVTALDHSFAHGLTKVGLRFNELLRWLISDKFNLWFNNYESSKIMGPIINLCQSSGSGKSKMAFELTQQGPGFFVVLRHENETNAFPSANNLSKLLVEIIKDPSAEPSSVLINTPIKSTKSGKCLDWITRIVVSYFEQLLNFGKELVSHVNPDRQDIDYKDICKKAFRSVRANVNQDFELIDENVLLMYCRNFELITTEKFEELTVNTFARLLYMVLQEPSKLLNASSSIQMKKFASEVDKTISQFPFTFVLDESNLLNDKIYRVKIKKSNSSEEDSTTGFQVFRRAISYFMKRTQIVVLTLGTKSDVTDLNPALYPSDRDSALTKLIPPIILSGNSDIFEKYNIVPFDPTHESLQNPITYKELVSYGHALWSSHLFGGMVGFAMRKLKNGDLDDYNMIPSVWMVRTGIKAEPTNLFAKDLVASRMATLFDLNPKLTEFSVSYPSEPLLAMAARKLCDTQNFAPETEPGKFDNQELLFTGLYNKMNAVLVDRGDYAENFAAMTLLRAIDKSPNRACKFSNETEYKAGLEEMILECEELEELWKKKNYLLEPENNNDLPTTQFPDYHVTTVGDFLATLFKGKAENEWQFEGLEVKGKLELELENNLNKLPEIARSGIINASHFVKLSRTSGIDSEKVNPSQLPLANDYVSDKYRNVIDRSLLRLGLRRQCGFLLPDRYFGIDAIIPVCLNKKTTKHNRPIYSFIGVQVKTVASVKSEELDNMFARFHFVTCPKKGEDDHNSETCTYCEEPEALETVFGNQIAISISVAGESSQNNRNVINNYTGSVLESEDVIKALYLGNSENILGGKDKSPALNMAKKKPSMAAFKGSSYSHEFRDRKNLEINLRVWKHPEDEEPINPKDEETTEGPLKKAKTGDLKRSLQEEDIVIGEKEPEDYEMQSIKEKIGQMGIAKTKQEEEDVVHRMFVFDWTGIDLIENHFHLGAQAKQSAAKILRKAFHINEYKEKSDIERYLTSVTMDNKTSSIFHNYVTQEWRGQDTTIINEEIVKKLVEIYEKSIKSLKCYELN